jgi:hypothetical protein
MRVLCACQSWRRAKLRKRKRQPYDERAADQQTDTPLDSTRTPFSSISIAIQICLEWCI